ncbi:tRNA-uridine aminocarboxypropyltransferase [Brumicola pallidula]|jgi:DTW domain-containing protein YfiP|nr:tRNA-uridine aminocarboxypropyltransferase [Glaciecola pallidula]
MCNKCEYPLKTCVCSAVNQIENKIEVIILQDKNEVNNAKNTARLVALCLTDISIIKSDDTTRLTQLQNSCLSDPRSFALFFPCNNSHAFEHHFPNLQNNNLGTSTAVKHLLFIDGTWRKAKRLYLSHEWLQSLPSFHFNEPLEGMYRIRKTSINNGISTLEAVAYVVSKTDDIPSKPLYDLFEKMQSFWPSN